MAKTVSQFAMADSTKCIGCGTCVKVCPVAAIELTREDDKPKAKFDQDKCRACTICTTRCPSYAISMEPRISPIEVKVDVTRFASEKVEDICRNAHMYPDQIVCYCYRVQAGEIAAAILAGAKTPEDVAEMTGARTGCGALCITGVMRLLLASGQELSFAPGYQWYGNILTIWDVPDDVARKFDNDFYLLSDKKCIDEVFPGGRK